MSNSNRPNKKQKLVRKFFKTLLLGLLIFFIAFLIATAGIIVLNNKIDFLKIKENNIESNKKEKAVLNIITKVPKKTNFLVIGLDKHDDRADTIMVVSFDSEKEEINVISIPRDTYVKMPKDRIKILKDNKRKIPYDGVMKLNEVHSYSGAKRGINFLKLQVEELLGIKIDYYIKLNLEGFIYIVDKIGGIEFDVPKRMYYKDPTQNLVINLRPGLQILDGKKAEGLIRYRNYVDGDIDRIKVQQKFIKVALEQIMNKQSIKNNMFNFIVMLIKYVETDFKPEYISKYIKYIDTITSDKVYMYILPNTPKYVDKISYVFINEQQKNRLVEEIFYNKVNLKLEDSKNKKIKILNTRENIEKAIEIKNILEKEKLKIDKIENYNEIKFKEITIFVKDYGYGEDIKTLLPKSILTKDKNITKDYDIVIAV